MNAPVLVTGATGALGRAVVDRLARDGHSIRALIRDPRRWHSDVEPDIRIGDLEDIESLAAAARGVGAIVAAHGGPASLGADKFRRIDFAGTRNLLSVAPKDALFVFVSSIYTGRTDPPIVEPGEPFRWKAEAETLIRASGRPYVIVRPSWLTNARWSGRINAEQGDRGEGQVSRDGVAAVIAAALAEPAARFRTLELYETADAEPPSWPDFFARLAADPQEI